MSAGDFELPWDSQPQEAVEVDWSNPLAARLVGLWYGGNRHVEAITGRGPIANNNGFLVSYFPTRKGIAHGAAVSSPNISFEYLQAAPTPPGSEFSLFCRVQILAIPSGDRPIVQSTFGDEAELTLLPTGFIRGVTNRANTTVNSDAAYSAGDWLDLCYVGREGEQRLWINGVRQAGSGTQSLSVMNARSWLSIRSSDAATVFAGVANRAYLDTEVVQLSQAPWQLFRSLSIGVPVAAGPALPTLSAITPSLITATGWRDTITAA